MALQIVSTLCACAGTISYFCNMPIFAILFGVIVLGESIINVLKGTQNNLITELVTLVVGLILALVFRLNIPSTLAVALCISNLLFTVIGWGMVWHQTRRTSASMKMFEHLKSSPESSPFSPELLSKQEAQGSNAPLETLYKGYVLALRYALDVRTLCADICDESFRPLLTGISFGLICAEARIFLHLERKHTAYWLQALQRDIRKTEDPDAQISPELSSAIIRVAAKAETFAVDTFQALNEYPLNALHSFVNIALDLIHAEHTPDHHMALAPLFASFLSDYAENKPMPTSNKTPVDIGAVTVSCYNLIMGYASDSFQNSQINPKEPRIEEFALFFSLYLCALFCFLKTPEKLYESILSALKKQLALQNYLPEHTRLILDSIVNYRETFSGKPSTDIEDFIEAAEVHFASHFSPSYADAFRYELLDFLEEANEEIGLPFFD